MGIISLNSWSSRANCADSANLSFRARSRELPLAGGFHASPSYVSRPASYRDFLFGFGGSGGESSSNGSSAWRSECPSPVACEVSKSFLVGVGLGSSMTSLWQCSFKITSSVAFGAVYRVPSLNTTSRGVVKRLGQWVVYEVVLSRYAVSNEYAKSGSVIQLLLFVFQNVYESQASKHTEMLQRWLPPMPGLVRSLADYRSRRSAVLEIERHWDYKSWVLLRKSGIVQHASYAFHDPAVRPFYDSIRLRSVGRSSFL